MGEHRGAHGAHHPRRHPDARVSHRAATSRAGTYRAACGEPVPCRARGRGRGHRRLARRSDHARPAAAIMTDVYPRAPLELWAGFECTLNRVGDAQHDQLELTGHYGRLDDLDRLAELGVRTIRYPILWERIEGGRPYGTPWEWTDRCMERLRALGIEPIVGLVHHGSGPFGTAFWTMDSPRASPASRAASPNATRGSAAIRRSTSRSPRRASAPCTGGGIPTCATTRASSARR